nr:hypothetical protein L204_04929 [Cryptococcus depauperatus CBS 7855]
MVTIDEEDVKHMRLDTSTFLFSGSVGENIDPSGTKLDVQLNDILKLIHFQSSHSVGEKSKLDSNVANEGLNH